MEPRVLFVAPRLDAGGAEIHLASVVPRLRRAGLDVSSHDRSSSNSSRSVYDLAKQVLVNEINLKDVGMNTVFGILHG
jgi:hypothetical protein